jgi:gamma-glutamyltranspeptidase/glutathione hydrolase
MLGLATPGADGQVQTLLQILLAIGLEGLDLAQAIARPRWRSEGGNLLIETRHPRRDALARLGHRVMPISDGELRFGAAVCAGWIGDEPIVAADWRRETFAAVV